MDLESLDLAVMGAIGWIFSVLAIVATEMETADLLR